MRVTEGNTQTCNEESNYFRFFSCYGKKENMIMPLSSFLDHLPMSASLKYCAKINNLLVPSASAPVYWFYACYYHPGNHPWTILQNETDVIAMPHQFQFGFVNVSEASIKELLPSTVAKEFDYPSVEEPSALKAVQNNSTFFLYTITD